MKENERKLLFRKRKKEYRLSEILTKSEIALVDHYLKKTHDMCDWKKADEGGVRRHCAELRIAILEDRPMTKDCLEAFYVVTRVQSGNDRARAVICRKIGKIIGWKDT